MGYHGPRGRTMEPREAQNIDEGPARQAVVIDCRHREPTKHPSASASGCGASGYGVSRDAPRCGRSDGATKVRAACAKMEVGFERTHTSPPPTYPPLSLYGNPGWGYEPICPP